MPANVTEWLHLLFKWVHVVAGIAWIGHLYFFNFVNAQLAKTYDADTKKKVVPELMPRALYWFRWGAAWTWLTGVLLLGILYYMGFTKAWAEANAGKPGVLSNNLIMVIGLASLVVGFAVYDFLWKSPLAKNEMVGVAVSYVLIVAAAFGLSQVMDGRSMFIHVGSIFGTIMAGNVWMRIWPAQRKIIGGIKGTSPAPDASVAATAGLRSKHNTYMSVPLVLLMVSNHFGTVLEFSQGTMKLNWVLVAVFIAAGWGVTKMLYIQSAKPQANAI